MELEAFDVGFAGRFVPRPRHHADDGRGRRVFVEGLIVIDVAPDRIDAGEEFLGQRFIDDDRTRPAKHFLRPEGPPADERHSHRAEVIGAKQY